MISNVVFHSMPNNAVFHSMPSTVVFHSMPSTIVLFIFKFELSEKRAHGVVRRRREILNVYSVISFKKNDYLQYFSMSI